MKKKLAAAAIIALGVADPVAAQTIEIRSNGSAASSMGSDKYFAGQAVVTPMFPANETTRASTGLVNFAPGARTAWHTHPAGQLLIVTAGQGWIEQEGQARRVINPGDVVWIPADVKHWHGATSTSPMAHIAVSYMQDGKNVNWLELVSDAQYQAK